MYIYIYIYIYIYVFTCEKILISPDIILLTINLTIERSEIKLIDVIVTKQLISKLIRYSIRIIYS